MNTPDQARELRAEDIPWTPAPIDSAMPEDLEGLAVELAQDAGAYRALAQAALDCLHTLHADRARLRDQLRRVTDEYRAHRVQVLSQEAVCRP